MRRRLFVLPLYLLLGAATAVGVAWTCNTIHYYRPSTSPYGPWLGVRADDGQVWSVSTWEGFGATSYHIAVANTAGSEQLELLATTALPRWVHRPAQGSDATAVVTSGRGWPARCVAGEWHIMADGRCDPRWKWRLTAWPPPGAGLPLTVGLRPITLGLAVDTGVFGGVWACVLIGPPALRAWARRRRGGCVHCGYDLKGLSGGACPECGAAHSHIPGTTP